MTRLKALRTYLLYAAIFLFLCGASSLGNEPEVPVVDGGLGSCKADFTVKDGEGKPIFNAKINVLIRYGFLGLHKTALEAGTNSAGKARFTGLPDRARKPLEFAIKSGTVSKTVTDDPAETCNAVFDVTMSVH